MSSLFKTVFEQNPHQHPLIYLKGVSFEDLNCILDFIYLGEVKVIQEELVTFLNVAEELQIDGLKRKEENQKSDNTLNIKVELPVDKPFETIPDNEIKLVKTEKISTPKIYNVEGKPSLFCNNCDFTSRFKNNLNRHKRKFHALSHKIEIETKSITCKYCGITHADKGNLEIHMQLQHKQKSQQYQCNLLTCDYKANVRSNLERHIRKIHASGPSKET